MLRKAWEAVVILLKGAGVLVAIVAILGTVGVIWLMINPPFASPKTGNLHTSATRDLTIKAAGGEAQRQRHAGLERSTRPADPESNADRDPGQSGGRRSLALRPRRGVQSAIGGSSDSTRAP